MNVTYILMIERAQHLQFTIYSPTWYKALKNIGQFLQSNSFSVTWISYCPETAHTIRKQNKQHISCHEKITGRPIHVLQFNS